MNAFTRVGAAIVLIGTLSCGDAITEPAANHGAHGCSAQRDAIFDQYASLYGYHEDERGCPGYYEAEMYVSYFRQEAPDWSCFQIAVDPLVDRGNAWVEITYNTGDDQ